jgi:pyruvate kinase
MANNIDASLSVATFNFSHNDREVHLACLNRLWTASKHRNKPVAVILDMKGPKIRTDPVTNDANKIKLIKDQTIVLTWTQPAGSFSRWRI